ncbi:hypothetical protein SynPROSU1_00432 [Synechococcus sp. PROS-U-1]|nr:hypothetical protein SynPROSU1_00432 [Synechococcus sp. PROS-U-1]
MNRSDHSEQSALQCHSFSYLGRIFEGNCIAYWLRSSLFD